MAEAKIIVVDDEKEIADLIALYLTNEDYEVHTFYNGTDALHYMETESPDLAVLDVMLPDICLLYTSRPAWVLLQDARFLQIEYYVVTAVSVVTNGEGGIRTHAPFRTNGFQDRLVMTTSIPLHTLTCFPPLRGDKMYSIITSRQCQQLFSIFLYFLYKPIFCPAFSRRNRRKAAW